MSANPTPGNILSGTTKEPLPPLDALDYLNAGRQKILLERRIVSQTHILAKTIQLDKSNFPALLLAYANDVAASQGMSDIMPALGGLFANSCISLAHSKVKFSENHSKQTIIWPIVALPSGSNKSGLMDFNNRVAADTITGIKLIDIKVPLPNYTPIAGDMLFENATPAAFNVMLDSNNGFCIKHHDEAMGVLSTFTSKNHGYGTEAFSFADGGEVSRVTTRNMSDGEKRLPLPCTCVVLTGAAVPENMSAFLRGNNNEANGLAARMLQFSDYNERTPTTDLIAPASLSAMAHHLQWIWFRSSLQVGNSPNIFVLSPEAKVVHSEYEQEVNLKAKDMMKYSQLEIAFSRKSIGTVGVIAAFMHMWTSVLSALGVTAGTNASGNLTLSYPIGWNSLSVEAMVNHVILVSNQLGPDFKKKQLIIPADCLRSAIAVLKICFKTLSIQMGNPCAALMDELKTLGYKTGDSKSISENDGLLQTLLLLEGRVISKLYTNNRKYTGSTKPSFEIQVEHLTDRGLGTGFKSNGKNYFLKNMLPTDKLSPEYSKMVESLSGMGITLSSYQSSLDSPCKLLHYQDLDSLQAGLATLDPFLLDPADLSFAVVNNPVNNEEAVRRSLAKNAADSPHLAGQPDQVPVPVHLDAHPTSVSSTSAPSTSAGPSATVLASNEAVVFTMLTNATENAAPIAPKVKKVTKKQKNTAAVSDTDDEPSRSLEETQESTAPKKRPAAGKRGGKK
ncbi:hypothetical protein HDU79_000676 [Rhizoclosmatium sp. JEL0117]|nr:hypothetical protein HDU79_000676 [Rhizoclosmatium sp. JEL0117]